MKKVRLSNGLELECRQIGLIHGLSGPPEKAAICFDGVILRIRGMGELKIPGRLYPDGDFDIKWLNKVLAESQYIEFEEVSKALIKVD